MDTNLQKYYNLVDYLRQFDAIAVAFSGGVDSCFLLKAASDALGGNATAVTCASPFNPKFELDDAAQFAKSHGVRHVVLQLDPLQSQAVRNNPPDRCYHCKRLIFSAIKSAADGGVVADGTNADDVNEYRPGLKAVAELGIISPLKEMHFTKAEVREFSRAIGLRHWDKPAYACLATRIPYNDTITVDALRKIERAEDYLMQHGFDGIRVRHHGDIARIEAHKAVSPRILEMGGDIHKAFADIGYKYATLDVAGYRRS